MLFPANSIQVEISRDVRTRTCFAGVNGEVDRLADGSPRNGRDQDLGGVVRFA